MLEYEFRLEGSPKDKHSPAYASRGACGKTLPVCGAVGTKGLMGRRYRMLRLMGAEIMNRGVFST